MIFDTQFNGRVVQVAETLDYADAVSNQVFAMDKMFSQMGFSSSVYSKWHHEKVSHLRLDIDDLELSEKDILVYHLCGYSEFAFPKVIDQYCTKILVYHNITTENFFDKNSFLYDFCIEGRQQLKDAIGKFHFFWGDSKYNLEEIKSLGVSADRCDVVPIIVSPPDSTPATVECIPGNWLFLGRIAPNKSHLELVDLFSKVRSKNPNLAEKLYIVGDFNAKDSYFESLTKKIDEVGLAENVLITGKISEAEREKYFAKSTLYVSLSAHEGFGVPLVEAPLRGLPVVALDTTAVGETMGRVKGLCKSIDLMPNEIESLLSEKSNYEAALQAQQLNAKRFSPEVVEISVRDALHKVLPFHRKFTTISVVICTYNRRDYLQRCLDYLKYQSNLNFEVVIVDGPSDDGTKEILENYKNLAKISHNSERNLSKSRNLGIELSSGDIVAFIDDDALPFDDWVQATLDAYNSYPLTIAGLGGPAYYAGSFWFQAEDNGINSNADARVNIAHKEIGKDGWLRYNTGTNATFVRQKLIDVGGFDEQYDYYLDESELCFRLQKKGSLIGYSPDVIVRHEFAQSHNRKGKYNYNWFTICKNTAYYVASYSGLTGDDLKSELKTRMERERVVPLDAAVTRGDLSASERDRHVDAIWRGLEQGLKDAENFPRTREIVSTSLPFRQFSAPLQHLRVGKDVKRLHICIVSKELPPFSPGGGIGTLYYHLASELLLMGHEVSAIVPSNEEHTFHQGRMKVYFTKTAEIDAKDLDSGFQRNVAWSLSCLRKASAIHAEHPIDVIDTALWDTEALALSLLPTAERPPIVLRLVTPYPVAARTNAWGVPPATASLFMEAERTLIQRADAVVPISESIAKTIEIEHGLLRDARWSLNHCGIAYWPFFDVNQGYSDFQEFEKIPLAVLESPKLIVFVGRLERRKGIDLLVEAAKRILSSDKEAQLLIAGRDVEGWSNRALDILPDALRKQIHFLGEVPDATRDKLLARAYCLVFPSRYESFGLVPLESFVHGTPVIASRSGAIPEVVEDGQCGLLFEAESPDSLADSVIRLLADSELRKRLSEGALRQSKRFSARISSIKAVSLYRKLMANVEKT